MNIEDDFLSEICWAWKDRRTGQRRPRKLQNEGIVFHKISGIYLFPEEPFNYRRICDEILEPSVQVPAPLSYNLIVRRSGRVMRLVPQGYQSKHAGFSRFNQRDYCNNFMLGVSVISTGKAFGDEPALTPAQVVTLCELTYQLIQEENVSPDFLTSHEFVRRVWNASHPDKRGASRDGDPGKYFPWEAIRAYLSERLAEDLEGG